MRIKNIVIPMVATTILIFGLYGCGAEPQEPQEPEVEQTVEQTDNIESKTDTEDTTEVETVEDTTEQPVDEDTSVSENTTTKSSDTTNTDEGGLIMDATGVDGVISDEDIAAGAYDEELNGDAATSEDTTDWEDVDLSQVSEEERQAILDEMKKKYREDNGFNSDEIFNGSNESVPDHIEGNPLPEGYVTPDNGELPPSNFGSGGAPDSLKGEFLK